MEALLGPEATEARVREGVRGKRTIHLATHGFVRAPPGTALRPTRTDPERWLGASFERQLAVWDPRLLSGLALAGANARSGGGEDDGLLTALEASSLDLRGVDLVVLSACGSARGRLAPGEGVLGLVRTFRIAGARDVVASLWDVNDEATRLLMERFHELLARQTAPPTPGQALRVAARWLRERASAAGPSFSAPAHWAAFVVYGRE